MTPVNSAFSPTIPFLQLAWDSTSLGFLKECPRKYFLTIVSSTVTKDQSVHLTFGILYHSALEAYDRARAEGKSHAQAKIFAVRTALTQSWNRELRRAWNSGDQYKNRLTLVRSIVWYLAQYENDPVATIILANGRPAVELSFRYSTTYISPDGSPYILCGHLDRVGRLENLPFIIDRKTTKYQLEERWFSQFSPDNQMTLYSFSGKIVYQLPTQGVMIDGAQVLVNSTRFKRGFTHRTDSQLNEWYRELGYWLDQAAYFASSQFWPMNDKSCGNYGGCPFRGICDKSPEVREMFLNDPSKFTVRSWNPLQIRGDV
jgi:PD-(D/E)XK nuclease superfamily